MIESRLPAAMRIATTQAGESRIRATGIFFRHGLNRAWHADIIPALIEDPARSGAAKGK